MAETKIKEISGFNENGIDKTRVVFSDKETDTEIIFEGSGKIMAAVEV